MKKPKVCQLCGEKESDSNLVGWCEVAEMWVCERCCMDCYESSFPYGCPSSVGLDFEKEYDEEDKDGDKGG